MKEFYYFVHTSPKWASILFKRILNNDRARENLTEKLYSATSEINTTVLQITKKINDESPKFLEKTFKVIEVAKKS